MALKNRSGRRCVSLALGALTAGLMLLPGTLFAQEEVSSAIRRYKGYEASTGYYEEFEAKPSRFRPFVGVPEASRGTFPYSPTAAEVRIRTRLADSHLGVKFYQNLRCETCHPAQAQDLHTTRANLTCRQCHGGEPIASLAHYYSPLNPIRRHAFVCSKCHEGASASFAAYVVHEPAPGSPDARKSFPGLFYAYWFMLILLAGTLAFFIPHSFLVGLRELFRRKGE
ncbi:MAG: cytochrome c3 family protein [Thermodesulfobacteriota bacterium]